MRLRALLLPVHRYVGLVMSAFLLVAGLTGSVLAFYHELDALVSPGLLRTQAAAGARPMDPLELRARLAARLPPGLRADYVPLEHEPGKALRFYVETPDHDAPLDDEYFVDPYNGKVLGSRRYGDLGQGAKNLVPFLYSLHYSLALGTVGSWLMGVAALLWTFDCFVGAYLTFPPRPRGPRKASWLARWKPAWLLRANHLFAFVFTWHRASGLWLWALLLVFAWSAVGLNLNEVYTPVMRLAVGAPDAAYDRIPELASPRPIPALSWEQARERGRALMAQEAAARGFTIHAERRMSYDLERGVYRYQVESSLDLSDRYPDTTLWLDGNSGALQAFHAPSGEHVGITATTLLFAMHFGALAGGGLAYRVFVCMLGTLIALLSISGVWIWWRKRRTALARAR